MEALAQKAVEALVPPREVPGTDRPRRDPSPFRFLALPPELRQKILQYTDLVTRWREVEWNPHHALYYSRAKDIHHATEVPDSLYGNANIAKNQALWRPEHLSSWFCWERTLHRGCFCKSYHAAYSSAVQCKCWAPPTPLFLVCKLMREDAMQVFFSHNRFVIAPECVGPEKIGVVETSPVRLPISIFLSDVVPTEALRHLRFLDIYFPAFGDELPCDYCPAGSPEQLDWIDILESVKDKLSLPNLTLRVSFGVHPEDNPDACWGPFRRHMSGRQGQDYKNCYIDTLAPLKAFNGRLKRFFAHLPDPQSSCYWEGEQYDTALERIVENMVMGEGYQAIGKSEVPESILEQSDQRMN